VHTKHRLELVEKKKETKKGLTVVNPSPCCSHG
jgi:hypothetical protein